MVVALAIGGWDDTGSNEGNSGLRLSADGGWVNHNGDRDSRPAGGDLDLAALQPTPTPTATPTPTPDRPARDPESAALVLDAGDLHAVACDPVYDWSCSWAVAVILCENGGSWEGFDEATGVTYWGGWQLALSHGFPGLIGASPALQTLYAWTLYQDGGAAHWPACP